MPLAEHGRTEQAARGMPIGLSGVIGVGLKSALIWSICGPSSAQTDITNIRIWPFLARSVACH